MRAKWTPSKGYLVELKRRFKSYKAMAQHSGVSIRTVRRRFDEHGILASKGLQITKKRMLEVLKLHPKDEDAAAYLGISYRSFRYRRNRFGIKKLYGGIDRRNPVLIDPITGCLIYRVQHQVAYRGRKYEDDPRAVRREQLFCWRQP